MEKSDLDQATKKVLFISNGHGEDLNAVQILKALRQEHPQIEIGAMQHHWSD
jgi:hypothetical protein